MSERKVRGTAVVEFTVKVSGLGTYGSTCQLEQLYRQCASEADSALKNLFLEANRKGGTKYTVIGAPKVQTVLSEEE